MSQVLNWVWRIAVFYLLMTVTEQLLPSEKYRKYVRLYLGVVFLLLVLSPAASLAGLKEDLTEAMEQAGRQAARDELRIEQEAGNEARYRVILSEYREWIRTQTAQLVSEEGYSLEDLEVDFEEDPEAETFGRIREMRLTVAQVPETGMVRAGETDLSGHPVMEKIRADLAQTYEIETGQIVIQGK